MLFRSFNFPLYPWATHAQKVWRRIDGPVLRNVNVRSSPGVLIGPNWSSASSVVFSTKSTANTKQWKQGWNRNLPWKQLRQMINHNQAVIIHNRGRCTFQEELWKRERFGGGPLSHRKFNRISMREWFAPCRIPRCRRWKGPSVILKQDYAACAPSNSKNWDQDSNTFLEEEVPEGEVVRDSSIRNADARRKCRAARIQDLPEVESATFQGRWSLLWRCWQSEPSQTEYNAKMAGPANVFVVVSRGGTRYYLVRDRTAMICIFKAKLKFCCESLREWNCSVSCGFSTNRRWEGHRIDLNWHQQKLARNLPATHSTRAESPFGSSSFVSYLWVNQCCRVGSPSRTNASLVVRKMLEVWFWCQATFLSARSGSADRTRLSVITISLYVCLCVQILQGGMTQHGDI